jgi:hypothetical protein
LAAETVGAEVTGTVAAGDEVLGASVVLVAPAPEPPLPTSAVELLAEVAVVEEPDPDSWQMPSRPRYSSESQVFTVTPLGRCEACFPAGGVVRTGGGVVRTAGEVVREPAEVGDGLALSLHGRKAKR